MLILTGIAVLAIIIDLAVTSKTVHIAADAALFLALVAVVVIQFRLRRV